MAVGWDTRLTTVVGGKASKKLLDELALETVGDLLTHYPRTYLDMDQVSSIAGLVPGDLVTLVARVDSASSFTYRDKRTGRTAYRTEVRAQLGDGDIWMTFFDRHANAAQWRTGKQLVPGLNVLLSGRFERNTYKRGRWELIHPEVEDAETGTSGLMPVYRATTKLPSALIRASVRTALDVVTQFPDPLPDAIRSEHDLLPAEQAIRWIHRPQDRRQSGAAAKRLRFDEAFVAQVVLAQRRRANASVAGVPRVGRQGGIFDAFDERMPFELTAGQRAVEKEILDDLAGAHPMHRLLQGEVGSGKTVVALRAMLRVVDSGGQAALLAPTEVLAQQHHRSLSTMLGDLTDAGLLGAAPEATRIALLTGSLPAAARRAALEQAASGEAGIVVGTHALLEEHVTFADLGLAVVDEQHRFGVEQRAALTARSDGAPPHVLVMTATPIPRTVAMTVFGDLDTSSLVELPAGRSPTQTTVVPLADQPGWMERVWERVREEVAAGRQAYVVCPRISGDEPVGDPADGTDFELDEDDSDSTRPPLAAVEEVAPQLTEGPLRGLEVAVLHGRQTPDHKEQAMRAFADGKVDVLVATTVVEVGVDVPNATTMVVLDADRFGISQLHQLRGRVGRGHHSGLCLLVSTADPDSVARRRLDAVASTSDGFALAELDLELRKEGDVLGKNQSGSRRALRLLSVIRHAEVIEAARQAATALVEDDPELAAHDDLRAAVAALNEGDRADYLEKV